MSTQVLSTSLESQGCKLLMSGSPSLFAWSIYWLWWGIVPLYSSSRHTAVFMNPCISSSACFLWMTWCFAPLPFPKSSANSGSMTEKSTLTLASPRCFSFTLYPPSSRDSCWPWPLTDMWPSATLWSTPPSWHMAWSWLWVQPLSYVELSCWLLILSYWWDFPTAKPTSLLTPTVNLWP